MMIWERVLLVSTGSRPSGVLGLFEKDYMYQISVVFPETVTVERW